MMKRERHFGFYMEVIIMLCVLIFVIRTLAGVFTAARLRSLQAKRLSDAVTLAAGTAELIASCSDEQDLMELLPGAVQEGSVIRARFSDVMEADPDGVIEMLVEWQEDDGFVHAVITVLAENEEVYTLTTGVYLKGEGR